MAIYDEVNAVWPKEVPAITRAEAQRAVIRLVLHFGGKQYATMAKRPVRRCWISLKPYHGLRRGWRRLVHDVSHRLYARQYPHFEDHGRTHGMLELEMSRYVVAKGWLTGTLRPQPPKPKVVVEPTVDARYAKVLDQIKRWETKRKRAETALTKLNRRKRALARRLEVAA